MTAPQLLLGEPTQVLVGTNPSQIMTPYNGDVLIYNLDANNTVYVGYRQGLGVTNATVIQPQTPVVISAKRQLWAFSTPGPALINVTPEGSYQGPGPAQIIGQLLASTLPSLIASAVQSAGVPPIDMPTAVEILINQTVAAGASFNPGHISMGKYQSWVATLFATATSSGLGTNPYTKLTMQWSVASDNFDPTIVHDWVIPNTPFNFFYNYRNDSEGPVFGDTVDLTFKNNDTQPVNITIGMFGSFRTRSRPKLVGRYHYNTGDGTPQDASGLGSDGIAIIYNPSGLPLAPNNQTPAALMNLLDGPAVVTGFATFSAAGTADWKVSIAPQPNSIVSATLDLQFLGTALAPGLGQPVQQIPPTLIMLPRRVCTIQLTNQNPSVGNITGAQIVVTAQEQPE